MTLDKVKITCYNPSKVRAGQRQGPVRLLVIFLPKKTRVFTKSIYDQPEHADGLRILVTRYWPRGIKKEKIDIWKNEVAPSIELLKSWKSNEVTEAEYATTYIKEMENEESKGVIRWLAEKAKTESITLICFEKEGVFCHRHILKSLIEKEAYNV